MVGFITPSRVNEILPGEVELHWKLTPQWSLAGLYDNKLSRLTDKINC